MNTEQLEETSTEFQKKLIELASEFSNKLPPDIIILAMASITGKFFEKGAGMGMKRSRLKTLLRKKIGV